MRHYHELPNNNVSRADLPVITLEEAAYRLGISSTSVRRMIDQNVIPATQVVACAPWEIPVAALDDETVLNAVNDIKKRVRSGQTHNGQNQSSLFANEP